MRGAGNGLLRLTAVRRRLRVLRHPRLVEKDRTLRRNAGRDQACRHLARALAQRGRILCHRDGVKVDDTVDGFETVLKRHPVPNGTKIIAKV